jgi:peptidoglycan hydrolase CwlO-like protein
MATTIDMNSKGITLKDVQKHIILTIIAAIISGVGAGIGFYYRTTSKIDEHTQIIEKLTQNVDALTKMVDEMKTDAAIASTSPANQQKQIDDVKRGMDKLETKIDRIYDLMLSQKR